MRLPWITRAHHDEVKDLLSTQLAELKAERQKLLDHIASFTGRPIYAKPEPRPEPKPLMPEEGEDRNHFLIRKARHEGISDPRKIAAYIEKQNIADFEARRNTVPHIEKAG